MLQHTSQYCVPGPPAGSSYAPPLALQRTPLLGPPLDPSGFPPLCYHGMLPAPLGGPAHLAPGPGAMPAEAGLLEGSALWDMSYGGLAMRAAPDLSSGSSGYQSGTSHTGRGQRSLAVGKLATPA